MSTKRPIRCAIYTRKSSEEGLEQDFNSLDAQREACEAYVTSQKAEGWIALTARYDDGGYSGGTLERPALRRLLAEIEIGAIDVVVVYKIDRLSRSLMDFSRLVELFDRKSVTFVSVTQSFNTTTSMGRLTLNVLLSFAQFEREVTGERIRDKIAASKRKGIWMGGNPPLGYDVGDRKLVVNPGEAKTVQRIFRRYLELGCVRLLCDELTAKGVVSKRRTLANGEMRGGTPMGRTTLDKILGNRTYLGETTHRGKSYKGEHDAIVDRALFNAVQERVASQAPPLSGTARAAQEAPYADLVFDETGTPMLPTYSIKKGGIRYRYYASKPTMRGERSKAAIARIPAPPFEEFLGGMLKRLDATSGEGSDHICDIVRRIEIQPDGIIIQLERAAALTRWRKSAPGGGKERDRQVIERQRERLADGEVLTDYGAHLALSIPMRARFRGGRATLHLPPSAADRTPRPDLALIKAVARAHRWRQMLLDGEVSTIDALAKRFDLDRGHVGQTLKLGFLSPELTRAVAKGEQPRELRLTDLIAREIPVFWEEQRTLFSNS